MGQAAVNMVYKKLIAGLGYRSTRTGFVNAGFRTTGFTMMLGYDHNFGPFYNNYNSAGSWELMMSFNFRKETPKGVTTNLENW